MASPAEPLTDWLDASLTDELLASVDLDGPLSADENNLLFSLLNDSGAPGTSPFLSLDDEMFEDIDDKKVVLASVAAAGLRDSQGKLKHAFSMGDLQALEPSSPPEESPLGATTSLESVPECTTFDPGCVPAPTPAPAPTPVDPALMNLSKLSTDELERELSRRRGGVRSESSESDTLSSPAASTSTGASRPAYVPAPSTLNPAGFAGAYMGPPVFPQGLARVQPGGIAPGATMGAMGAIAAGMVPGMPMGPMQHAIPCNPNVPKVIPPGGFFLHDGSLMLGGMPTQQDALRTAAQQQPIPPMAMPVPMSGLPSMPPQMFFSQPLAANTSSGPSAMPPASTPQMGMESPSHSIRKSQSTPVLSSLTAAAIGAATGAGPDVGGTSGEGLKIGRLTAEERRQKVLRYRQKRHERKFEKRVTYQCRKTLADSRPRVRGRFARNNDSNAVMPSQSKKSPAAVEGGGAVEELEGMVDVQMAGQYGKQG